MKLYAIHMKPVWQAEQGENAQENKQVCLNKQVLINKNQKTLLFDVKHSVMDFFDFWSNRNRNRHYSGVTLFFIFKLYSTHFK